MSTRKRKAHFVEEDVSPSPPVSSPVQAKTKTRPQGAGRTNMKEQTARQVSRPDTESQQLEALGKVLHKSKKDDKEIENFRDKVEKDRESLRALLRQRQQALLNAEHQHKQAIAAQILEAFKPLETEDGESDTAVQQNEEGRHLIIENRAFTEPAQFFQDSRSLIKTYEEMAKKFDSAAPKYERVRKKLEQDSNEAKRILKIGYRISVRDLKKVIGVGPQQGEKEDELRDVTEEDWETFPRMKDEPVPELDSSLRYLERGIKRMVKPLPRDMEI